MKDIRPTRFLGVPRVFEKIEEKMREVASQNGAAKAAIFGWSKSQSAQYYETIRNGGSPEPSWQFKLSQKVIFR